MEQRPDPMQSLESMISTLATEPPNSGTQDPATPPAQSTPPPAATPPAATPPAATPPAQPPAAATPPATDPAFEPETLFGAGKQNAAFASMRVNNRKMEQTLFKLGDALGVQTQDPEILIEALNRKINEFSAERTGVPVELLEKVQKLTQDVEQRDLENAAAEATRGFQRVKDEYKLTNKELSDFAIQLKTAGKNPFASPMDLMNEYRLLNFDKLVEKAKADALTAATARQQHGQDHSSQPSQAAPAAAPGTAKPVKTVAELEELMKSF